VTNTEQSSQSTSIPNGSASLIVFGLDGSGKPHASAFGPPDTDLARKAANMMGMAALSAATDELRGLAAQLPKGRVFASGRAFVPFVKPTVFDRLIRLLPQGIDSLPAAEAAHEPARGADDPQDDQDAATGDAAATDFIDWSQIKPGHLVLATEGGDGKGWFEAQVVEIRAGSLLVLRWRDWPDLPVIVRRPEHVALLHPNSGTWA
jgi:hypothetical protein